MDANRTEERRIKRAKLAHGTSAQNWQDFEAELDTFEHHHVKYRSKFAFAFVEGPIAKAVRDGHWLVARFFLFDHTNE